jgi:hypothetical protein
MRKVLYILIERKDREKLISDEEILQAIELLRPAASI